MNVFDLPVGRPVAVSMAFLALVLLGLVAWQRIPVELMPAISGDSLHVSFWRQGAEPELVERDILLPLHARASALPMVTESGGRVRGSSGDYWLRFEPGGDIKVRELELRRIAVAIERQQPRGTASLRVFSTESQTSAQGSFVMLVHVLGDADREILHDIADEHLTPRFAALPGVNEAIATGGARRRLTVRVDPDRAAALGITPEQVVQAVRRRVKQIRHVGDLDTEAGRTSVLADGRLPGLESLRDSLIKAGSPARVRHVAEVEFGFAPQRSIFRVNGEPAVGIAIFQEQGANLIRLGRALRARVAQVREEIEPLGLDLVIGTDAAELVEDQIGHLARLGLSGYLIALAVLFLFMRQWRAVAVVGIAVPVSVLGALALLYLFDQTLNLVSLVGLSLSVGLLIDNSIVVYEAVLGRLERGVAIADAARVGVRRTARAITATSLTTGIVFLPTTLVELGSFAQSLIEILALSLLLPLVASLLVAIGLVPVLAHRLAAPAALRRMARQRHQRREAGGLSPPKPARILFGGIVAGALRRPSAWLAGTLFAVLITTLTALPVALSNDAPADAEQADEVKFTARAGKGQGSVGALSGAVARVERALMALDGVETVLSDIDEDGATIEAQLVAKAERPAALTVPRVRAVAREAAEEIGGFELLRPGENRQRGADDDDVQAALGGGPREVVLSGPETGALARLARDVAARLRAVPSVARAWLATRSGMEELWVQPRPRAFEAFGLTAGEVMPVLQLAGREGVPVGDGFSLASGRELPVYVERLGARRPTSARDLRDLRVHTESGVAPLAALTSIRQMPPPPMIVHRNGRREMSVYYRLHKDAPRSGPAGAAVDAELAAVVQSAPRPPDYIVELKEDDEDAELFRKLALPAVLLVLLVLAMTFESLTLPVLVLLALPLALLGATWLLVLTNTPAGIMGAVGAVALFGLAINPAILMVDRMQQKLRGGWSAGAAALAAVRERTRPVLMTSATTIAALWPLALVTGRENELWPPFATVVIGGIATATLLTLLVIPVGAILVQRLDRLFGRVGPWPVVGWLAATVAIMAALIWTGVISSLAWQLVTALLVGGGLLAITALTLHRPAFASPRMDAGPPAIEVRNLRKVYGLPGPLRRAMGAPREFAERRRAQGGLVAVGGFEFSDAAARFGPPAILVAAPLLASAYVQGGGWKLLLWLLASGFAARLLGDVRRARGRVTATGQVEPGGVEGALRCAAPWLALALFGYSMILLPSLAGEPPRANVAWPLLAALLVGLGQLARSSAVRQQRGGIGKGAVTGRLRGPRTLLRRWARRVGGLDLPARPVPALVAVNFRVTRGMVGILGPNGAGKTTLLRQLAGILEPTRGVITLGGVPLGQVRKVLARWVGYLPQDAGLPDGLSAREYLTYYAALYELPPALRQRRVADLLGEVGLEARADDRIKALSGGMRQRVAVARTLLRLPPVIIVDEPTVGLDPRERIRFRNLLARLAEQRIVLFSTHVVEDVAVACERVLVLAGGRLVFDGEPAALAGAATGKVWEIHGGAEWALPEGAILAEEAPTADGAVARRVIAAAPPAATATPLQSRLEDGYLWLISRPGTTGGPSS